MKNACAFRRPPLATAATSDIRVDLRRAVCYPPHSHEIG